MSSPEAHQSHVEDEEIKRPEEAGNSPEEKEKPENQRSPAKMSETNDAPFSVYSVGARRAIVFAASLAGFFSPLSASIYYPALPQIARDFNVSNAKVNLTVTTYLIIQGLAPMITGGFSDTAGRRPAYFVCFTIYFFACLGLAIQNNYVALLVLRCLQSAGSSGTIAIANGVVSDIVTPQERGAFIAFASLGTILGPSVSPVIGGLLAEYLGWHSIFWFLVIFTGSFCVPFFAFFPETCRKVVGDGSAFPPPLNRCLTDYVRRRKRQENNDPPTQPPPGRQKITFPNPMLTLKAFAVKESAMLLVPAGLSFGSYYALLTGASDTFKTVYGFSEVKVSLMYIPLGAGGIVSAFSTGKLVDWNFQRHARRLGVRLVPNRRQDLSNFPIEKARLQIALPIFCLGSACVIIYGWVIEKQYTVAAPIILMLVMSWAISAFFQVLNVLLVDTYPGRGAAVTAAVNIARCEVGAAAAAAISPMTEGVGAGFAYTIIALITFATLPMLLLAAKFGMKWRGETADKERKKAEEKCARRQVIEGQVPR